MKARIVLTHQEVQKACCAWIRDHGITDFNDGDLQFLVNDLHANGQKTQEVRASVDAEINPK